MLNIKRSAVAIARRDERDVPAQSPSRPSERLKAFIIATRYSASAQVGAGDSDVRYAAVGSDIRSCERSLRGAGSEKRSSAAPKRSERGEKVSRAVVTRISEGSEVASIRAKAE